MAVGLDPDGTACLLVPGTVKFDDTKTATSKPALDANMPALTEHSDAVAFRTVHVVAGHGLSLSFA
jgi:hypothetical protein